MKKAILAAAAAALIAGSATTFAANTTSGPAGGQDGGNRAGLSAQDQAIVTDARIGALKAGLKLTAEQEKLWPAVEGALRDAARSRAERRDAARATREAAGKERPDPITRMRTAADRMDAAAGDLRKIADASEPLYKTLDDAQKARLNALIRQNMRADGGPGWSHGGPHGMRRG